MLQDKLLTRIDENEGGGQPTCEEDEVINFLVGHVINHCNLRHVIQGCHILNIKRFRDILFLFENNLLCQVCKLEGHA